MWALAVGVIRMGRLVYSWPKYNIPTKMVDAPTGSLLGSFALLKTQQCHLW